MFTTYALYDQWKDPNPYIKINQKGLEGQWKVMQLQIGRPRYKKWHLKSKLTSYIKFWHVCIHPIRDFKSSLRRAMQLIQLVATWFMWIDIVQYLWDFLSNLHNHSKDTFSSQTNQNYRQCYLLEWVIRRNFSWDSCQVYLM